jgi:predicted AAA+ superfamily ATPase
MIARPIYLKKLSALRDKDLIKVVTGVRRCGKSTLLRLFREQLGQLGITSAQIHALNFEDEEHREIGDYRQLLEYLRARLVPDRMNYVFLDEVQMVDEFEKAVDSLYVKPHVDLYITGSNARMLSGELATLLSGRFIEIRMLPLSFAEYLSAFEGVTNIARSYQSYLRNSSFPYALELAGTREGLRDYLRGIYNTVLLKDVVARKRISDVFMLESVVSFMFDNIGNPTSTKRISDTLASEGRKVSVNTLESYLSALLDSYILYKVGRYDIKGRQHLKTVGKYYAVDMGLRFFLLGARDVDAGRVLENVVYLELIRRGYDVHVGKWNNREIDFVADNGDDLTYYQVALTVRHDETLRRELKALDAITDHNPKILLTLDDDLPTAHNGIRQINVLDWLLG